MHRWSLGMDKQFYPIISNGYSYFYMLGWKWIYVSKTRQMGISHLNLRPCRFHFFVKKTSCNIWQEQWCLLVQIAVFGKVVSMISWQKTRDFISSRRIKNAGPPDCWQRMCHYKSSVVTGCSPVGRNDCSWVTLWLRPKSNMSLFLASFELAWSYTKFKWSLTQF